MDAFQPIKDSIRISPNGKRVAFLSVEQQSPGGTRWFAVVDGEDQRKYDLVGRNSAVFSPDSKHLAYVAVFGKVNISEVNKYFRTSDVFSGEMFVVVDGKEDKHYKHIGDSNFGKASDLTFFEPGPPVFSPDSKHLAYVAQEKGLGGLFVVVDGKEWKHYEWIGNAEERKTLKTGTPIFSPDSNRIAYVAQENRKVFVVADGNEGKRYDDVRLITFSPDSKRVTYAAKLGDKWLAVIDANEGKQYDGFGLFTFSPDSNHLAYRVQKGKEMFIVLDSEEGKVYNRVLNPIFSPDSNHLAYLAQEGDSMLMVVNKKEGRKYAKIAFSPSFLFSPNSKHVGYGAQIGKEQFVVLFGETVGEKHYDRVDDFIFSPDSKHFAHTAVVDNKWFVVLDGKEQKKYDAVGNLTFTPDSRYLAYVAFVGKKQLVVVDGTEGRQYDGIIKVGAGGVAKLIFDSADNFHYLAVKDNTIYLVEETLK